MAEGDWTDFGLEGILSNHDHHFGTESTAKARAELAELRAQALPRSPEREYQILGVKGSELQSWLNHVARDPEVQVIAILGPNLDMFNLVGVSFHVVLSRPRRSGT